MIINLQKLTVIFSLLTTLTTTAQHMEVKSFKLIENDTEALLEQRKTPDGEPCVLIKVVTPYKNFQFDFYAAPVCLVENSKKVHEVWVWVRDDARRFEIQHKDLGVYRGRLSERLRPYKVYEMILTTEKFTTVKQEKLDKLRQEKEQLAKENEQLKIDQSSFGTLQITTNEGADIYIDGEKVGTHTFLKKLLATDYLIEIKKEKHITERFTYTVKRDKNNRIKKLLEAKKGTLIVSSTPSGAIVKLNGEIIGKTPLEKKLTVGAYKLTVAKRTYDVFSNSIWIQTNETNKKIIELTDYKIASEKRLKKARKALRLKTLKQTAYPRYDKFLFGMGLLGFQIGLEFEDFSSYKGISNADFKFGFRNIYLEVGMNWVLTNRTKSGSDALAFSLMLGYRFILSKHFSMYPYVKRYGMIKHFPRDEIGLMLSYGGPNIKLFYNRNFMGGDKSFFGIGIDLLSFFF